MMLYISIKFHENILNSFEVIKLRDGRTVRQTDRQIDNRSKNKMSPPLSGGHIIVRIVYMYILTGKLHPI